MLLHNVEKHNILIPIFYRFSFFQKNLRILSNLSADFGHNNPVIMEWYSSKVFIFVGHRFLPKWIVLAYSYFGSNKTIFIAHDWLLIGYHLFTLHTLCREENKVFPIKTLNNSPLYIPLFFLYQNRNISTICEKKSQLILTSKNGLKCIDIPLKIQLGIPIIFSQIYA